MSNALYDKAREKFLSGAVSWTADAIKCVLLDAADYVPDLALHEFLSDVPGVARVGSPQTLAGKTATAGVADGADITFPAVQGDQSEFLLLYKDTGVETTSPLLALIDTATGLPVTPNGGDITVQWDNGANKIFKL